ncbi:MAG: GIY-YIG nuclease family protein [Thermosynechococcaceae cyanobacterium MS004]|nr:GIY-YIG nuclease family protein [Thermosynechococcaceae cyanobacterium MS004]
MQKKYSGKRLASCCVYGIRNTETGRVYVGSSTTAGQDFKKHNLSLERGKHRCKELQDDYNRLGTDGFVFEVLQAVSKTKSETLPILEQKWMNEIQSTSAGLYNTQDLIQGFKAGRSAPQIHKTKKRSNPSPVRSEAVKQNVFQAVSILPDEPLAKKAVFVTVGQSVYDFLQNLDRGDRINLMRQAITDAVEVHRQGSR